MAEHSKQGGLRPFRLPFSVLPLGVLFIASIMAAWWLARMVDHDLREELLTQARMVARAVDIGQVKTLSGSEADLDNFAYMRLKEQFAALKQANAKCRFIYLLGRKIDGSLFFIVDNEPPSSIDYSPPGQVYAEAPAGFYRVSNTLTPEVEGPVSDRWGTWVSAIVPLIDPTTGKLIAVLGMDVDSSIWKWDVIARATFPIGMMLVLLIAIAAIYLSSRGRDASPKPVLRRLLYPLASVLFLFIGGIGWLLLNHQGESLHQTNAHLYRDVSTDLPQELASQSKSLSAIEAILIQDESLRAALKAQDRDGLLNSCAQKFASLRAEQSITHFYFLDPQRVCLLRFHKPERYGDRIDRFTAREAERTGKTAAGIELGPLGTFTLRVVRPIFDQGTLIGYIELGKEIEDIFFKIHQKTGAHLVMSIHKHLLNREWWEAGMRFLDRDSDWDRMAKDVLIYSSISPLPAETNRFIDPARRPQGEVQNTLKFNGAEWQFQVRPLQDVSGTEVGELLVFQDISALKAGYQRQVLFAVEMGMVLLAGLFAFLFVMLRRTDISTSAQQVALVESEARYRAFFEKNYTIQLLIDPQEWTIRDANAAACKFYGYPAEKMRGMKITDINMLPKEDILSAMVQIRTEGHGVFNFKHRLADGQIREVEVYSSPIFSKDRVWLHSIIHDVTDQKRTEDALRQAQKMESIGQLAGGVAHDFNNMLNVILGYTELAMGSIGSDHAISPKLEHVQKAAHHAADLTRQLLGFARKQTIQPALLDLNETIDNLLKMLMRVIGENIELSWHPMSCLWPVKVDSSQIGQILINLCVNARDAITDVGTISIETDNIVLDNGYCMQHPGATPGDFALLAVSDTGSGIRPESMGKLFEPFYTTKEVGKGTGLGLATVYGIVKQNNGYIEVQSTLGKGTTFKIYLPRHDGDPVPITEKSFAESNLNSHEIILLVEDDPASLNMITMMLEQLGYTVLPAASPREAVERVTSHGGRIDLLMTDVVMPEMNGRDLAVQIKAHDPKLTCLFMSGYPANIIADRGILDEGVQFIQKPFTMADLSFKLRETLKLRNRAVG